MSEKSEASVTGSLPHSRPQRRSAKREAKHGAQRAAPPQAEAPPGGQAAQPEAAQPEAGAAEPSRDQHGACSALPDGAELIGTVVRAAAELAEIGLTVGARALRTAVSRLPRP